MTKILFCTALLAAVSVIPASAQHAQHASSGAGLGGDAKVTVVYDHAIPNVPGKSIKGILVEYAPGGSSPPHLHAKSAFIYATVLEGEIKSQVNDGPVKIYHTGENWSENPGDHHGVSANASATKPARILAVFVVDTSEKSENLTTFSK
jgi:quercetin dioxygenase-like cupin family protein